jgi:hypothetical protein
MIVAVVAKEWRRRICMRAVSSEVDSNEATKAIEDRVLHE